MISAYLSEKYVRLHIHPNTEKIIILRISVRFRRGSHVKPEEEEEEDAEDANYSGFEMVRTPSVASLTSLEQKRNTREKELAEEKEKEEKTKEEEQKEKKKKEEESRATDRQVMMANAREKGKEVAKQALEIGTKVKFAQDHYHKFWLDKQQQQKRLLLQQQQQQQ